MDPTDWQNSFPTIELANLQLLSSNQFSDVTFIVGGGEEKEEIRAHKFILMTRSSYFEVMFQRWETGQNSVIKVPEVSSAAFKAFLEYLYSNKFSIKTGQEAADLLYIAHKYNIKYLQEKCSEILKTEIDFENVIHIHSIATKMETNPNSLEFDTMNYILKNGNAVFTNDAFLEIKPDVLSRILQKDNLEVDELIALRGVMRWAENQCEIQSLARTPENKRLVLVDVIHHIRFPLMSLEDFTEEVIQKNSGILTEEEVAGILLQINTKSRKGVPVQHFNSNERIKYLHRFMPYSRDVGPHSYKKSCRFDSALDGDDRKCEDKFGLSTDRDIWIKAVEIFPLRNGGGRVDVSIFVCNPNQVQIARAGIDIYYNSSSSPIIQFERRICISKDKLYLIALSIIGKDIIISDREKGRSISGTMNVSCGKDLVEFTFDDFHGGKCIRDVGSNSPCYEFNCICNGRIKAIYFSL